MHSGRFHARGQRVHIAFSGDEPLHGELRQQGKIAELEAMGARFHELPYISHTLKPLRAQQAANSILDKAVGDAFAYIEPGCTGQMRAPVRASR